MNDGMERVMSERYTPEMHIPETDPLDAIPFVPDAQMLLMIAEGFTKEVQPEPPPPVAPPPLSVEALRMAAALGDTEAMMQLGVITGRAGDRPGAVAWYRRAADVGNGEGLFCVGRAYLLSEGGYAKDVQAAMAWYKRSGDAGHAEGYWGVGEIYDHGRLGKCDADAALPWYTRAADAGDVKSMREVGDYWLRKARKAPDSATREAARVQALQWLARAALHDDRRALNTLVDAYEDEEDNTLVEQDLAVAIRLRQRLFALGAGWENLANLAVFYEQGYGCHANEAIAALLYVHVLEEMEKDESEDFSLDDPALLPLRERTCFEAHREELCTLMGRGEDDPFNFLLRGVARLSADHAIARDYMETRFFVPPRARA
ncbi:hypothetical protein KMAL_30820 [Novacetimonas maltaceti]|uniref:Sel1 repeat family protein n=2 Tax=Novacetimonas maltaceti TaxID=1203393 RepID=A0A2S3VXE9_9PROT|nr:hypothetical protein KMAL_30820 [Novacetimonas maltaceti]